jgi:hypothetical protein
MRQAKKTSQTAETLRDIALGSDAERKDAYQILEQRFLYVSLI